VHEHSECTVMRYTRHDNQNQDTCHLHSTRGGRPGLTTAAPHNLFSRSPSMNPVHNALIPSVVDICEQVDYGEARPWLRRWNAARR
jgi:hypothetical protein